MSVELFCWNGETERSAATSRALLKVWTASDLEALAFRFAPRCRICDVGAPWRVSGSEGARETLFRYLRAFPDLTITVEEAVVQGPRVAIVWIATGTHQGTLMNIPPTGRRVAVRGASVLRVRNEKIVRALHLWDVAGLLRSLGLLPQLRGPEEGKGGEA